MVQQEDPEETAPLVISDPALPDKKKSKYGEDFDMFSPPELAPSNTIPTLVFHDVDDRDTPISLGREVGEKMAHGTYIETSGLGHRRILRDSKVIEQIMNWSFNIS